MSYLPDGHFHADKALEANDAKYWQQVTILLVQSLPTKEVLHTKESGINAANLTLQLASSYRAWHGLCTTLG